MKKNIIIGALLLIVGVVIGWLCKPGVEKRIVDIQRDTTYVLDTHVVEKPIIVESYIKDTMYVAVRDTVRIKDTLYVGLPYETKVYWEDEYYAEVSGYNPTLDYLEIFRKNMVVTETIQEVANRHALSIGVEMTYMNSLYVPIYFEYEQILHKNIGFHARLLYDFPTKSVGASLGAKLKFGW